VRSSTQKYYLSIDGLQEILGGEEPSATSVFDEDAAWPGDIDPEVVHRMLDDGPAKDAFYLVRVAQMTQAQAAEDLGVSQPTVSRLIAAAWREYRAPYAVKCAPTDLDNHGPRVQSTFDLEWGGELRSDHYVEAVNGTVPPYSRSQLRRAQKKVRPLPPEAKKVYDRKLRIAERRYNPTPVGKGIRDRGADPAGRGPDENLLRYSGKYDLFEDGPDTPQQRTWPFPAINADRPNYRMVDGRRVRISPQRTWDGRRVGSGAGFEAVYAQATDPGGVDATGSDAA
jgi:hypothetical protein